MIAYCSLPEVLAPLRLPFIDGSDTHEPASEFDATVHDHDSAYQKKYANVIVVAKSGGDLTDPISAMNSISDASATNHFLLKIMPGVYDIGTATNWRFTLKRAFPTIHPWSVIQ